MLEEIYHAYNLIKNDILERINEFELTGKNDRKAFMELIFCILTPQSKAERCWNAVISLGDLIINGEYRDIVGGLEGIRFKYNKARYIVEARKFFRNGKFVLLDEINGMDEEMARKYLIKNVKGFGYKEASHFLRNIGKGKNLAILDRHILRKLKELKIIDEIPAHLSEKNYIRIEKKMRDFSNKISIPMLHLDFVLWYMERGKIFK